jgi:hypothetical protein
LLTALLSTGAASAEAIATARLLFADAWKRSECNQLMDTALNNARYHELGGGYALGMVLCWLGPNSETQMLFLVAPKTSGRPHLLRFEEWRGEKFEHADVLPMPTFNSDTRTIVSYRRYSGSGVCGAAGEWTWTGSEFKMTGYWDKPDCKDESEFDRSDRFRIFPKK